jgi:hypothetical protein
MHLFSVLAMISVVSCTFESCSEDIQTTQGKNTDTSHKNDTGAKGYFSVMSVTIKITSTAFVPFVSVHIDSAGKPLTMLPTDTISYNGRVVLAYDSLNLWSDAFYEIVDSGKYVFTFSRRSGDSTVSSSFTLPLPPFHITGPPDGSTVTLYSHTNDTIFYSPAGGRDITALYRGEYADHGVGNENEEPDSGKYHIIDMSSSLGRGPGYLFLIRHFVGTLTDPGAFKTVNYDYCQSSRHINLVFNW